jgi:hypothetical protein
MKGMAGKTMKEAFEGIRNSICKDREAEKLEVCLGRLVKNRMNLGFGAVKLKGLWEIDGFEKKKACFIWMNEKARGYERLRMEQKFRIWHMNVLIDCSYSSFSPSYIAKNSQIEFSKALDFASTTHKICLNWLKEKINNNDLHKKAKRFATLKQNCLKKTSTIEKELQSNKLLIKLFKISTNNMRKHFSSILNYPSFLLKQGFDSFIHNFYQKNIETINKTWKWKLSNTDSKYQRVLSQTLSNNKLSTSFLLLLDKYISSLQRFSFCALKKGL